MGEKSEFSSVYHVLSTRPFDMQQTSSIKTAVALNVPCSWISSIISIHLSGEVIQKSTMSLANSFLKSCLKYIMFAPIGDNNGSFRNAFYPRQRAWGFYLQRGDISNLDLLTVIEPSLATTSDRNNSRCA